MSSKDLVRDLVVLTEKTRPSTSSKSEGSGKTTLQDNEPVMRADVGDEQDASLPPSYEAITSDETKVTTSTVCVDIQQPPSEVPSQDLEITESQILDLATSCFPPVPSDLDLPPLPKPVLIPRINPGPKIPFARVWVPELANHGVTREDLLSFIDNLNILIRPHPAIRVVELAAFAVGFVPYDVAEGVASGLEALAILATIAMNYKRCKAYFALLNEKYFHPRKLHVKVIGSKRMMKMLHLGKKDPLVAPLSETTLDLSTQERCLKHLSQWACELSFDDIPPPSPQTNILAKMAAWEVRHKISKADKQAKRSRKRAWKKHLKGKKFKESWEEKWRVKRLDWILIQNLDEWETRKAEKLAKKEERRRTSSWRTIR
ncbi:hypothetical protein GGR54DRAFT_215791 [Hypoxylon sp. NC1633]|nr:hypothetical protein GGR54DRAFT_215791 [Hypoxylon sp. NC1633]